MGRLYWAAQAVFVALVLGLRSIIVIDPIALLGLAVIQLALVSWRLWISRSCIWVALAPPLSNVALWFSLEPWVASQVGGDGRGFVAGLASMAWCVISYVGVAIWAGLQQKPERPR